METDAKYYAKTTKSALALDINDENAYNNKKMCLGETQFEKNRNILLFWQVKESMGKIRKLRNHNIIRYSISILLILAMMLGLTCSVETPSAVDAATLNGTAVANLWKAKRAELQWCDSSNNPLPAMWETTSSLPTAWLAVSESETTTDAQILDLAETATATDAVASDGVMQASDMTDAAIPYAADAGVVDGMLVPAEQITGSIGKRIAFTGDIAAYIRTDSEKSVASCQYSGYTETSESTVSTPTDATYKDKYEDTNSTYDFRPIAADNSETLDALYYSIEYDEALAGYYRRYYVSTADQLAVLLYYYQTDFGNTVKAVQKKGENLYDTEGAVVNKLGICLLCDIDLGGVTDQHWIGYRNSDVFLELDGNGHTVYNGSFISLSRDTRVRKWLQDSGNHKAGSIDRTTTNYGCFLRGDYRFAVHDATFANMFLSHRGGLFGESALYGYFNNVNFEHCLAAAASNGVAIVLGWGYLYCYMKDCMVRNSYVYGEGHCAMFSSYNGGSNYHSYKSGNNTYYPSYFGDTSEGVTEYYHTEVPELSEAEYAWRRKTKDGQIYSDHYPSIYENCAAIDSEVYDTVEHSGTFVSCMQSAIIFKNCFTNCTIYASSRIGGFIGCIIGSGDGFYYEVEGEKKLANVYFENCYSSGTVEGQNSIGGFVGGIYEDIRAYSIIGGATPYRGQAVFKNCYSTASVGMQYAGNYVGGFAGSVYGNVQAEDAAAKRHIFINCYAAGEVGGITTDTSTTNLNTTGGFFGEYYLGTKIGVKNNERELIEFEGDSIPYLQNCYYDKQTTAMRERDIGGTAYIYDETKEQSVHVQDGSNLCQTLDGLTGVYTVASSRKNVAGLTDTVDMNDSAAWKNENGYYPELQCFTTLPGNPGASASIAEQMKYERGLIYYYYGKASTAAVFLDHYDEMLEADGTVRNAKSTDEDRLVYDTIRDITRKFTFTTDDGNNLVWATENDTASKNYKENFVSKLGSQIETDESGNKTQTEGGFTIDYEEISQTFRPNVLTIVKNGGVYKCLDFAPGKQWVTVTATGDGITGRRNLRLLPTAYLNAGNILHVNVVTNQEDGSVTNAVYYTDDESNEIELKNSFNHSVGVAYAITDKTRMADETIYSNQHLTEYIGESKAATQDTGTFAFYAKYSANDKTKANLIGANTGTETEPEISGMLQQQINVRYNANSNNNLSYTSGATMVKIYRAEINDKTNELEKKQEIEYTSENIKKWQGTEVFTIDDTGYYYLDYYWRLDDGRFLTDSKLVRITADAYQVEMVTGILEQEHTVDLDKFGNDKTAVDQYVAEAAYDADSQEYKWFENKTSELYPSTSKSDFAQETAASYYDEGSYNKAINYNDSTYYTKTMSLTTHNDTTVVGWKRATDYKLTTLIIEAIDTSGVSHVMARVDNLDEEKFTFDNAQYAYNYKIYSITQDPETKLFSIVSRDSVPVEFEVVSADENIATGIDRYIIFNFNSGKGDNDQQASYASVTDDLRVTALFRENSANISGTKTVLRKPEGSADEVEQITASKLVPITGADGNITYEEQTYSYYNSLSEADRKYEVDNNVLSAEDAANNDLRKAVLSGDTLTYRVKLQNQGFFESDVVHVYDTVPEGSTYVDGSMKIYRQKIDLLDSINEYADLEVMAEQTRNAAGSYETSAGTKAGYELSSPGADGSLQWVLPSLSLDYEYYVQYQVTVDTLAADEVSRLLTNTADWDFRCRNGDVSEDFPAANLQELKDTEIFTLTMRLNESGETTGTDENRTYEIEFEQKNMSETYSNITFTNSFPSDGFRYTKDSIRIHQWDSVAGEYPEETVDYANCTTPEEAEEAVADGKIAVICTDTVFTVYGLNIETADDKYLISFDGTQVPLGKKDAAGEIVTEISNKASVRYTNAEDNTKANSVALTERISNEVATDVTWLYLNIEKNIQADDKEQSFLMQVAYYENDTDAAPAEVFYTRVNCTDAVLDTSGNTVGYQGNQILQCGKRGTYVVTEVTDWSNTDYDFDKSTASDMSLTDSAGNAKYPSDVMENSKAITSGAESVTIDLPRLFYVSGAFPTSLGINRTNVPTAVFYNIESEYAYLSGQSYSENNIKK